MPADAGIASCLFSVATGPARLHSAFDNNMKRRLIPVLAAEALASMPTKQLLGRLQSLQQCEACQALSDRSPEEVAAGEGILFKNTAEWQKAYADLRIVLATREHVPSSAERAAVRQQRTEKQSNKRAGGDGGTAPLRRAEPQWPAAPQHER